MNLDEEASIDEEKKTEQLLDSKTLVSIKSELNDLIHRHSNVYELESSKQEIHLCNKSNPIQFNIGERTVGETSPPLVIAEIGIFFMRILAFLISFLCI